MQEYSRKAATAETRLEELNKRSIYHDDHLRVVDAWWRQVGYGHSPSVYLGVLIQFAAFGRVGTYHRLVCTGAEALGRYVRHTFQR